MRAAVRIIFLDENGEKFFGEGPCRLLHAVDETGSLRAAAQSMGMAYTKALKIMKNAEKALGFALTERMAGGKDGGGSVLTPEGKEWLKRYEAYRDACIQADRRLYLEFFPEQRYVASVPDRGQGKRKINSSFRTFEEAFFFRANTRHHNLGGTGPGGVFKGKYFRRDRQGGTF